MDSILSQLGNKEKIKRYFCKQYLRYRSQREFICTVSQNLALRRCFYFGMLATGGVSVHYCKCMFWVSGGLGDSSGEKKPRSSYQTILAFAVASH